MSDARLRELERRWKETGSYKDEAAYLLERVRVGDLEREKLELAAYCGHEGAREAGVTCQIKSLSEVIQLVGGWSGVLQELGLVGIAKALLPHWEGAETSFDSEGPDYRVREVVEGLETAVRTGRREALGKAKQLAHDAWGECDHVLEVSEIAWACCALTEVIMAGDEAARRQWIDSFRSTALAVGEAMGLTETEMCQEYAKTALSGLDL